MDDLTLAMLAGAVIVATAAVITFFTMPDRAHDDVEELDEEFATETATEEAWSVVAGS